MNCPKCDTRIKKDMPVCPKCGFRVEELENVSNIQARKALNSNKILEREKVFYVFKVPKDLVRKDLILFTILTGLIGGHNFYVGRILLGVSKVISLALGIMLSIIIYRTGNMSFYSITGLLIAYPLIAWIYDVVRVLIKRYPIPVVIDETK